MCKEKERYLVIDPDSSFRWILADPDDLCSSFRKAIGCDWLENVYTVLPNICIVVDEVGKVKDDPQPLNPIASRLYAGTLYGDFIHGPAVVVKLDCFDGEYDWCPCTVPDLLKLASFLNIDLSAAAAEDIN